MLVGAESDGNARNHCEFILAYSKKVGVAQIYNSFGWGQVKSIDNISQMSLIEDGDCLKNSFDKNFRYSTLYRLKDEVQ